MQDTIHTYIRDVKNNPIGIVLATKSKTGNKYSIGWSLTKVKCGDKFDKGVGMAIALGRASCSRPTKGTTQRNVKPMLDVMSERAALYFKGCSFSPSPSAPVVIPIDNNLSPIKAAERHEIVKALISTNNNKARAASILKIGRQTIYNKIKEFQIEL